MTSVGSLSQHSVILTVKRFLVFVWNFPCCSFCLLLLVLSAWTTETTLVFKIIYFLFNSLCWHQHWIFRVLGRHLLKIRERLGLEGPQRSCSSNLLPWAGLPATRARQILQVRHLQMWKLTLFVYSTNLTIVSFINTSSNVTQSNQTTSRAYY